MKILIIILVFSKSVFGFDGWSGEIKSIYQKRDFTALKFLLKNTSEKDFLEEQQRDLRDCGNLQEGKGDLKTVLTCMRFIEREGRRNLISLPSLNLLQELDQVCLRLIARENQIENILLFKARWSGKFVPHQCKNGILKQAQTEIYSLAEDDLIKAWSLYRRVKAQLAPPSKWVDQTFKLLVR